MNIFSSKNLPTTLVVTLIVLSWLGFISVMIAG